MDRIDEILAELNNIRPPESLNEEVMHSVERHRRRARTFAVLTYAMLGPTTLALFLSSRLLLAEMASSSLPQILDLSVTDSHQVLASLGAWLMALFEALPVVGLVLSLGTLFFLLLLLGKLNSRPLGRGQHMKEVM